MAISPAKAHFQRKNAAQQSADPTAPIDRTAASQYELMLAKLAEDKRRLKDIQSIERKIDVKRQLLPDYQPWIEGILQGDTGQQDDVFMTVLVWTIDTGDIEAAIPLAKYAIRHQMAMPDQYKRTTACVIAEEAADIALKGAPGSSPVSFVLLGGVAALTADEDMPDEVRAKLHKAIGYGMRDAGLLEQARERLAYALQLHDKVGVKKDIERLDTLIKNAGGSAEGAA